MKVLITLLLALLCSLPTGVVSATAQTRDNWRSVRTNNLFVIGNAEPDKLRQVAAWLEFFHSAFARLVSRQVLDASVPTTVIIFRDDDSFTPFKPGSKNITGYFQPGEDVNYIAIALDPRDKDQFSTAFHEYVHLHVRDNIPEAPLWLNEGLAELYGSIQFSGSDALLGAPIAYYLRLLRSQELLPLSTLFSVDTRSAHYNEQEKSGVFYGQSWALVHYLMFSDRSRQEQFRRFIDQVSRGDNAAKAIQDSYGISLEMLEQELKTYVRRGEFAAQRIASVSDPQSYAAYTAMQRTGLTDAEANFYLGDLLLHTRRDSEAERYLKYAITADPGYAPAHAALGLMYVYQRRYADAKPHLQKAAASPQNYMIHYLYAFVLSREGLSADGSAKDYPRESAAVMRDQLRRAIQINPNYAPAYHLFAFINLVTDERMDEAYELIKKALQLASKANYSLVLAQIHLRRDEPDAARPILETLARNSDVTVRKHAENLLESMTSTGGSGRAKSAQAVANVSAVVDEPSEPGSSRMLGGESGSVAIRDGQTIEKSAATIDDILAKYVEALGGEKAIKAVNSRVTKGTLDVTGVSRGNNFETHSLAPNKLLTTVRAHPVGLVKIGFDGRNGWILDDNGLRSLKGAELASLQRDSDFYMPVTIKNVYSKVTLAGTSKIGFRDVYVIEAQAGTGPADRLYLDTKTYLPVRMNVVRTSGNATENVEIYFDDWREVDGIKFPFHISQSSAKVRLSYSVREVVHNAAVDPKIFEQPPK